MPDLIIKPTNTSGNKVIIQDQAGGAVLTTADSGATFSGGNIGTVTAGNISHADIVYPAGHCIQVVSTSTTAEINSSGEMVTHCFANITTKKASSRILILPALVLYANDENHLINTKIMYKTSTGRSATVGDYTEIIDFIRAAAANSDNHNSWLPISLHTTFTHGQSAGTTLNIAVIASQNAGILYSNNAATPCVMTLMEIMS